MNGKTLISVMKIGIKHYRVFPCLIVVGVVSSIFQSLFAADGNFYLSFPLPDYTATTAQISSVFDHSMTTKFCADGIITAYSGDTSSDTSKIDSSCSTQTSTDPDKYTYPPRPKNIPNYNVKDTGLSYDGHPGYDYSVGIGKKVLAAAPGTATVYSEKYNTLEIEHAGGYATYYSHLSSIEEEVKGKFIERGKLVGYSGEKGSEGSPHLHFGVYKDGIPVDPYGWDGNGADPYEEKTGFKNIDLWTAPTSTSTITHTLIPPSKTTVSQGGVLGPFTVKESNNSSSHYAFYVQPYVKIPSGTTVNFKKISTGLGAGEERTFKGYLYIPASSELGTFTFGVKITDTSGNLIDDDSFECTVVSGSSSSIVSRRSTRTLKRLMRNPEAQVMEEDGWKVIIVPEKDK